MLTRTSGGVTTTFLWDGWDCIRESTPTSTTHYLIPEGQLLGFRRDGEHYSVASDALGCVRLVTDSSGDVVFRRDYGTWGETLPGGFDNVPGGMPYGFVGALGVRTDADSGLIYMRQRWYDPLAQRFISRDPIGLEGGKNLYSYADNAPLDYVDPDGLRKKRGVLFLHIDVEEWEAFKQAMRSGRRIEWLINSLQSRLGKCPVKIVWHEGTRYRVSSDEGTFDLNLHLVVDEKPQSSVQGDTITVNYNDLHRDFLRRDLESATRNPEDWLGKNAPLPGIRGARRSGYDSEKALLDAVTAGITKVFGGTSPPEGQSSSRFTKSTLNKIQERVLDQ